MGNWGPTNHYKVKVRNEVAQQNIPWEIGYDDDSGAECNTTLAPAHEYTVGSDVKNFPNKISKENPESKIKFTLSEPEVHRSYRLRLDTAAREAKGVASFGVLVNTEPVGSFISEGQKATFNLLVTEGLRTGDNQITLRWLNGDSPVEWDYISFVAADGVLWEIEDRDKSYAEFSASSRTDDDYYIGEPDEALEWALISRRDPHTNIHFYLNEIRQTKVKIIHLSQRISKDIWKSAAFTLLFLNLFIAEVGILHASPQSPNLAQPIIVSRFLGRDIRRIIENTNAPSLSDKDKALLEFLKRLPIRIYKVEEQKRGVTWIGLWCGETLRIRIDGDDRAGYYLHIINYEQIQPGVLKEIGRNSYEYRDRKIGPLVFTTKILGEDKGKNKVIRIQNLEVLNM